ncbi:MAG: nickel-responsive transcriptional regulator NikR [Planctomycetota bacterium]|nr:nickel-responsive transcriptional regulator NikR [Planctomycetota bacterium]
MSKLTRTALAIEEELLARFDNWTTAHGYSNRSEALRDLVRSALVKAEWEKPAAKVLATLSIIYDHQQRELSKQLTALQHADHHAILCSQHVHLDRHKCLEVIVMSGTVRQLRRICDAITAARGVLTGKLTLLSKKL